MFYEHASYEVISEKKTPEKPELMKKDPKFYKNSPEFWDIECKNSTECDHCPHCGQSIKKRAIGYRTVYEYNEQKNRIERVRIASQRYRCKVCLKTFTAETTVDDITYTKDFEKCISLLMIVQEYSSTLLGAKYERSYKFISEIVHHYTSRMLLGFTPPHDCEALCLFPFVYQRKQRYFLASYTSEAMWKFICFFGHIDAIQEIRNYFSYPVNKKLTLSKPVLLIDYDEDLIRLLEDVLGNPKLAFIRELMENRLAHLKIAANVDDANAKATSINKLITIIFGEKHYKRRDNSLKYKNGSTTLRSWKSETRKHDLLSKCFADLIDKLNEYDKYLIRSKQYDDITAHLKEIMNVIENYNKVNLSYDVLSARIISQTYGNYGIDTEYIDMFMLPDNYDEASGTYYRQPLERIPLVKEEEKKDYDDEAKAQLEGILSLIEEEKAKAYCLFDEDNPPPFGPL